MVLPGNAMFCIGAFHLIKIQYVAQCKNNIKHFFHFFLFLNIMSLFHFFFILYYSRKMKKAESRIESLQTGGGVLLTVLDFRPIALNTNETLLDPPLADELFLEFVPEYQMRYLVIP